MIVLLQDERLLIQSDLFKNKLSIVQKYLEHPLLTPQELNRIEDLFIDSAWIAQNQLRYSIFSKIFNLLQNNCETELELLIPRSNRFLRMIYSNREYIKNIQEQTVSGKRLRSIQIMAAQAFEKWLESQNIEHISLGHIVAPPGVGKTLMSVVLSEMLSAQRTVFVVDSLTNGQQTFNTFQHHEGGKEVSLRRGVGKIFGNYQPQNFSAEVLVTTFSSLMNHFQKMNLSQVDLVVIDEADVVALSPRRSKWLKDMAKHYGFVVIGMTATEKQKSGRHLKDVFTDTVFRLGLPEALPACLELKLICPTRFYDVYVDIHEQPLLITTSDDKKFIHRKTLIGLNEDALDHYLNFHDGQKALFGFRSVIQLKHFMKMAKEKNLRVALISYKQKIEQRLKRIEMFKTGDYDILCGFKIIGRGLDLPDLGLVYNLMATRSPQLFWQLNLRASRVNTLDENKSAKVYNFVSRRYFDIENQKTVNLQKQPLTFSAFFNTHYFEIAKRFSSSNQYPIGYKKKTPETLDYEIGLLKTIRSIEEVEIERRNYELKYFYENNYDRWHHFFKVERGITAADQWLERYPTANHLLKDIGSSILTDLGIPYSGKSIRSQDYSAIFRKLFQRPLSHAYRLKWKRKFEEMGIDSAEKYLEIFPEHSGAVENIKKRFGNTVFFELRITHGEEASKRHYPILFKRLWGKRLDRYYLTKWRMTILRSLVKEKLSLENTDHELENIFIGKSLAFLKAYPNVTGFTAKFGKDIFKNLNIHAKYIGYGEYQILFEKLFLKSWDQGWRLVVLERLTAKGWSTSVQCIELCLNQTERLSRLLGKDVLNHFSFFEGEDRFRKLYEFLYGHSFQEGLRLRVLERLNQEGVADVISFVSQFSSADQFLKKYGSSLLKGIAGLAKSKAELLKSLIPFLFGMTYSKALSQYWQSFYLKQYGIRNINDFIALFPNDEKVTTQSMLLKSYQSYFKLTNISNFKTFYQNQTVYDFILKEVYGVYPPEIKVQQQLFFRRKQINLLAEQGNVLYFLMKDLSEGHAFNEEFTEEYQSQRETLLVIDYQNLYSQQKYIIKKLYLLTPNTSSQMMILLKRSRNHSVCAYANVLSDFLRPEVSIDSLTDMVREFLILENQKDRLRNRVLELSYRYLKWLSNRFVYYHRLDNDLQNDLIQRASLSIARAMDRIRDVKGWWAYKSVCVRNSLKSEAIYLKFRAGLSHQASLDETISHQDQRSKMDLQSKNYDEDFVDKDDLREDVEKLNHYISDFELAQQFYLKHTYAFWGEKYLSESEVAVHLNMNWLPSEFKVFKKNAEKRFLDLIETNIEFKKILFKYYERMVV